MNALAFFRCPFAGNRLPRRLKPLFGNAGIPAGLIGRCRPGKRQPERIWRSGLSRSAFAGETDVLLSEGQFVPRIRQERLSADVNDFFYTFETDKAFVFS